jgi:hypothetical protein
VGDQLVSIVSIPLLLDSTKSGPEGMARKDMGFVLVVTGARLSGEGVNSGTSSLAKGDRRSGEDQLLRHRNGMAISEPESNPMNASVWRTEALNLDLTIVLATASRELRRTTMPNSDEPGAASHASGASTIRLER